MRRATGAGVATTVARVRRVRSSPSARQRTSTPCSSCATDVTSQPSRIRSPSGAASPSISRPEPPTITRDSPAERFHTRWK
jgi:hypothetical protein